MPVDRRLWKRNLSETYAPPWPCPSCSDGHLKMKPDTFQHAETLRSRRSHGDEGFHWTDEEYVFTALLECTRCRENIACTGTGGLEESIFPDEDGELETHLKSTFSPRYFTKPPPLLKPPRKCPKNIRRHLNDSFLVFFCDLSAAANHVRQCAEEIVTHLGIAPMTKGGKFRSLAERARELEKKDPDNAGRVNALRWIGNFGSHPEKITADDVFNAYDILEVLLEDIFVGHQRSIRDLIAAINANKGPIR